MPSKYKMKVPKPPFKRYTPPPQYGVCSNCGGKSCERFSIMVYSKCRCGGTYQTFKGVKL